MTVKHLFEDIESAVLGVDILINMYKADGVYETHTTFVNRRGELVTYFELKDDKESSSIL